MKTQELNAQELININGGSTDSSSQYGLAGSLGIDNLLSFSSSSKDGDESKSSSFSVGNGISTSLAQLSKSMFD